MAEKKSVLGLAQTFIVVGLLFSGVAAVLFSLWAWDFLGLFGFFFGVLLMAAAWLYRELCRMEVESNPRRG